MIVVFEIHKYLYRFLMLQKCNQKSLHYGKTVTEEIDLLTHSSSTQCRSYTMQDMGHSQNIENTDMLVMKKYML